MITDLESAGRLIPAGLMRVAVMVGHGHPSQQRQMGPPTWRSWRPSPETEVFLEGPPQRRQ